MFDSNDILTKNLIKRNSANTSEQKQRGTLENLGTMSKARVNLHDNNCTLTKKKKQRSVNNQEGNETEKWL